MPGESYTGILDRRFDSGSPRGYCYPELSFDSSETALFGYNFSHPESPLHEPFEHFSGARLGANPAGQKSAAIAATMREPYEPGGYVAIVIPFFSEDYLPEQYGLASELIDFRRFAKNTTNRYRPRYWCVRLSANGRHFRQLCDPTTEPQDGDGDVLGVVRAAVEQLFNDLRRSHCA